MRNDILGRNNKGLWEIPERAEGKTEQMVRLIKEAEVKTKVGMVVAEEEGGLWKGYITEKTMQRTRRSSQMDSENRWKTERSSTL